MVWVVTMNLTGLGLFTKAHFYDLLLLHIKAYFAKNLLKLLDLVLNLSFVNFERSRQLDRRSSQLFKSLIFINDALNTLFDHGFFSFFLSHKLGISFATLFYVHLVSLFVLGVIFDPLI